MPTIEWVGTPNFSSRDGRIPLAIVNHITAGRFPGCLDWMRNPISASSAQYLILRNGRILQLVKELDKAWANGVVNKPNWSLYDGTNPNDYTISIEHEALADEGLTEAQYQSSLWLQRDITKRWKIPIDTDHLIGHYRIDSVERPNCPGKNFPWDRLLVDLRGGNDVLDHAVVYFTDRDFSSARMVSDKLGGCAMFCRNGAAVIHPDVMTSKHPVIIGGPEYKDHPNVTNCCGLGAPETAILAAQYAQKL